MSSTKGGHCGGRNSNSECVLEDELSNIPINMMGNAKHLSPPDIIEERIETLESTKKKSGAIMDTHKKEETIAKYYSDKSVGEAEAEEEEEAVSDEIGIRQCFVDFCRQTILHGWHYLVDCNDDLNEEESPDNVSISNRTSPNLAGGGSRFKIGYAASQRLALARNATRRNKNYHAAQSSHQLVPKEGAITCDEHISSVVKLGTAVAGNVYV